MFLTSYKNNFSTDFMNQDISVRSGIPKDYYHLKDHVFQDWEIPPWELFIYKDKILGKGSFSTVYLAKWRETFVVAKVIDEEFCKNKKNIVLREFDIMTKIHHPNIVQFLGYIDDPFIIVLEYIPKGNLLSKIPKLKKTQKISIMKDILRGICYIHNRQPYSLIHRDIKPTNILLTNSKVAKIADFGLSKFYNYEKINSHQNLQQLNDPTETFELTTEVGTERYMAPEMLSKKEYDSKIDIYACGIMFYEMFENKRYIPNTRMKWVKCPNKIKTVIMENMLCQDPDSRLSAINLLKLLDQLQI